MSATDNPLVDMTGAMTPHQGDEHVPNPQFRDTALPGFKQALTARRSIRVFDGEPIPDGVMRDCLQESSHAMSRIAGRDDSLMISHQFFLLAHLPGVGSSAMRA